MSIDFIKADRGDSVFSTIRSGLATAGSSQPTGSDSWNRWLTIRYSIRSIYYKPWNYTTKRVNNGRFAYPDQMPTGWSGAAEKWTLDHPQQMMQPVLDWSKRYNIPTNRILVGEFGCNREVTGAQSYLADLVQVFNQRQWHWAFYAYREDTWTGMDYELGTGRLGWKYWQAIEAEEQPEKPRGNNPLFDVLRREFR